MDYGPRTAICLQSNLMNHPRYWLKNADFFAPFSMADAKNDWAEQRSVAEKSQRGCLKENYLW
jgi:hypothetical protein